MNNLIHAMHVGDSGSGKSVAAASYPKPYNQLDCDLRYEGIEGAVNEGWLDGNELSVKSFHPRAGYEPLEAYLNNLDIQRISGTFPFKTMELASLGALARLIYNYSIKLKGGGKKVGILKIGDPSDINTESNGVHQVFDFLRSFPCNLICSAHIIDKYGKVPGQGEYSMAGIIGHKLAVRDNLNANVQTYFGNVFLFTRGANDKGEMRYYVNFSTDLAKNTFGIPPGEFDITGKPFYPYLQELIIKIKNGEKLKEKVETNSNLLTF